MVKSFPVVVLASSLCLLTGCGTFFGKDGFFRNRGDEYLKAEEIPPLAPDHDQKNPRLSEIYVVPNIEDSTYDYTQVFVAPRPIPLSSSVLEDTVKIQKLSGRQWIFVSNSPSEVWPQVREFLGDKDLPVAYTDATDGLIETTWLQFSDDKEHFDRFQLRIETGIQPESAEIHVLHSQVPSNQTPEANLPWPKSSTDDSREAWMIDELSSVLASNLERSSSSLLAQTIGGEHKVVLGYTESEEPILKMKISYLRAWASVNHALEEEGFYLWGRDSNKGVFYSQYQKPKDNKGSWIGNGIRAVGGLFSGVDKNAGPTSPYTVVEVLENLPASNERDSLFKDVISRETTPLKNVPGYLVVVRESADEVHVFIRDGYARRIDEAQAKQLLSAIRNNLI
ncbi:hypothetical protein MAH1_23300 [Sessilibacter sp. MAH1]